MAYNASLHDGHTLARRLTFDRHAGHFLVVAACTPRISRDAAMIENSKISMVHDRRG